jgi:hypothetical protein
MENASNDLVKQVEEMKSARMTLTPDEEKLFSDPVVRELLGPNGVQATLIANAKPDRSTKKPRSGTRLRRNAHHAGQRGLHEQGVRNSAKLYQDALRAEPEKRRRSHRPGHDTPA